MGPYGCQTCRRSSSSSSATGSRDGSDRSGIGGEIRSGTPAAYGDEIRTRFGRLLVLRLLLRRHLHGTADATALVGPAPGVGVRATAGLGVRTAASARRHAVLRQGQLARALHLEPGVRDHLQVGLARLALAGE